MDPTQISALFTTTSLVTLEGSAGLTTLVPNVLGYLFGAGFDPYRKWAGFIIAMALALLAALTATGDASVLRWVVALANGFLIYASAVGVNKIADAGGGGGRASAESRRRFFRSWY